jgi:hypothetical protein
MARRPDLRVISGGTSEGGSTFATPEQSGHFERIGVVDSDGRAYYRDGGNGHPPNPPTGGTTPPSSPGGPEVEIAHLKQSLGRLWGLVGASILAALGGFVGLYFALANPMQSGFDRLGDKIGDTEKTVSGQAATMDAMKGALQRIESKLDNDKPQTSP